MHKCAVFVRSWSRLKRSAVLLPCLLLVATLSFCQMETATLSGTVMDPSSAVVPDALVQVTNSDTNITATARTNKAGVYVVSALKPGRYRVLVTKQGFKQISVTDVMLNVQDVISRNFNLQLGAASETISVTADGANINTQDASVSTVVDRNFAENLPMNGRSFQTLIQLTPGVVLTTNNGNDQGQFSINGQRAASNYWMVDGVSANIGIAATSQPSNGLSGSLGSFSASGGTNSLVSVDAMQEFRIQTSTFAPEFGRTPGGQISIATRSGTNGFHGALFDYLRNDALDANDWFADNKGLPKPGERQNDFGGTLGGPVVKDRTFFFFSYEGLRLRLPQTTLTTVPNLVSRQNAVPALQPYLNAFPLPNGPTAGNGVAEFNASYSNKSNLDAYSLRVDQKIKTNLIFFARYNYSPSDLVQRGQGVPLSNVTPATITTQTATAGATWTILPSLLNDLRLNYSRTGAESHFVQDTFGGAVPVSAFQVPSPFQVQNSEILFIIGSLINGNLAAGTQFRNTQRQFNIVDNVAIQRSSHSLKFGIDYRRLSPDVRAFRYFQESFFDDVPSAAAGTPVSAGIGSSLPITFLLRNVSVFGQDTWRITPRMTVTYGLRWDIDVTPRSLSGPTLSAVTGYDLKDLSRLALAPVGALPFQTTYGNIAPRFGVAYQVDKNPDRGTVVRGGFGVFYDLATSEVGNLVSAFSYPDGATSFFGGSFPFTASQLQPPQITPDGGIEAFDPNLKLPYTLQWNVAVEHGLGRQQSLSASYVGAAGRRLLQTSFISAPTVSIPIAQLIGNSGSSDYNALQIQFERRLTGGFQALASYVWSHSIDTASAGSFANKSNRVPGAVANANRGASDFDIRHALSAALTYQIPSVTRTRLTRAISARWSLQSIIQARSGPPVDITDAHFSKFNNRFFAAVRPDLVLGQPLYLTGSQFPGGKAFNPAAFIDPPADPKTRSPLRQGTLPRNVLRAFGAVQWDAAVHRDFHLVESVKLQFRAEMFNVLNHPNFGAPSGRFGAGGFGISNQTLGQSLSGGNVGAGGFSPLYQIGGPRSIQLALKLMF